MAKHSRPQLDMLIRRAEEPRRFIQVLMGPRQVGKTTIVRQLLEQIDMPWSYFSADGRSEQSELIQQWNTARIKYTQSPESGFLLVIDEIQKIPDWSEMVKMLWDEDTQKGYSIKVVLLGSSRLMIQSGLSESLAGRFETHYVPHWSYSEMKHAFGWTAEQFAWFGGYPGAAPLIEDEKRWKEYVQNALIEASVSKDILQLSRIEKPALMKRLFELGCNYSGQILSYTKILGQFTDAGNTTTLSNYLHLLDTAGLLGGLEKFSGDVIRQRSSSPKFQVHNTAFISALSHLHFEEFLQQPVLMGRVIESAVGAHLLNHSLTGKYNLYYWREGNHEMDFVLQKGQTVVAVEVKSGNKHAARGSEAFLKRYPDARLILIDNNGLSWQEFLGMDPMILFNY